MKRFLITLLAGFAIAGCGPETAPKRELPPIVGLGLRLSGVACPQGPDIPRSIVAAVKAQFEEDSSEPPPISEEDRATYQAMVARQRANDWADLCRYQSLNWDLTSFDHNRDRVVFIGDSITQSWPLADPAFFHDGGVVPRGISGQTTPQILVRFRRDVIELKPAAVHILAGINDIAGNTGPTTLTDITNNIQSMVEIAKANDVTVILATPLPASHFNWAPDQTPAEAVATYAAWIRRYAAEQDLILADYYTPLVLPDGSMKPQYTLDGVHPNKAGYALMKPILEQAIAEALAR